MKEYFGTLRTLNGMGYIVLGATYLAIIVGLNIPFIRDIAMILSIAAITFGAFKIVTSDKNE